MMRALGLAVVLAACAMLLAGAACAADPAPTLFVSPTGSDSGSCTKAAPCASLDKAYRTAKPGEAVEIAAGTYPPQTINVDVAKVSAAADVILQPAAGATVTIAGDLVMLGSHAVIRGLHLHFLYSQAVRGPNTSNHVTFENLDGAAFLVGPNRDITIQGGDWGPNTGPGTQEDKIGPDGGIPNQWPTNIVLDGVYVHDQNSNDLSVEHMGGLFLVSGGPITIRNSRFERNVVYDIQVQDFTNPDCCGQTYGPVHDVLLENNVFLHPVTSLGEGAGDDRQPEVQLDPRGGCWVNWTVRRNSFENGIALGFDRPPCFQNVTVSRNFGPALGPQCFAGAAGLVFQQNFWRGAGCSSADGVVPFGYALSGTSLAPAGTAAAAVRKIFALAARPLKVAAIAKAMGRAWPAARVAGILKDTTYRGNAFGPDGAQPALVDAKTWTKSRRALR
jgi:hypothetical protein